MSKGLLIIDANALGFSAHRMTKLTVGGKEVQAIFGFIKSVRYILKEYRGYEAIAMWDGRSWRKDISTEYKANREANAKMIAEREAYKEQRPYMAKALTALGVRQMMASNMEADDLAAMMAKKASARGVKVVLITGDKDWLQLVDENVVWHDPIREKTVNIHTFEEMTGYRSTDEFIQGKALQGDVSDNIKGVGGIGEKGAEEFMRKYGSVGNFLEGTWKPEELDKLPKKERDYYNNAVGGRDRFLFNMRLMNLGTDLMPQPKDLKVTKGEFNLEEFKELCAELGFHSVLKDLENWVQPFKGNN